MTTPRLGRPFSYPRQGGQEETCPHVPAMHVVYDLDRGGYRVKFRCRCGSHVVEGRRVYPSYVEAENAGKLAVWKKP